MMNALGMPGMMRPMTQIPQVGMVPGVPGSMGLNPGASPFPQTQPSGPFSNALMDWRQQRPMFNPANPGGFQSMMSAWRQQRPIFGQPNPGGPIMTPGGGGTGAPLQGGQMMPNPMSAGQMPINPTAGQMSMTSYQLPTY